MKMDEIRRIVARRPWQPLEVRVDNGDVHRVPHPENLVIINDDNLAITGKEHLVALLGPDAISAIHILRTNGRRASARR